ncbi:MAG: hypothetical protein Q7L55_00400 [Actinomycetota bacterium]|nr:hypothetical protein [Actinomycetota bacterium]
MLTETLIQEASPIINRIGGAFYFTPETLGRGRELGLNGLQFYFIGRGGVLGDVEWPVVVSAFGYFSPTMVNKFWNSAQEVLPPREGGRAFLECSREFGRLHLTQIESLDSFCAAAEQITKAIDPFSLPLYAAVSCEPFAEDLPARAMQYLTILREHRGSAHLLALVAVGLDPRVADVINSAENYKIHGWAQADLPVPTPKDLDLMYQAHQLTNQLVSTPFSVLDDEGQLAFITGLRAIEEAVPAS